MAKNTSRRNFLRTAPVAAAAGFTLSRFADGDGAGMRRARTGQRRGAAVQAVVKANELADDMKALDAKPGDNRLYDSKAIPVQIILTVEKHKSATEFEWHEGRDHIVQIIDGSTLYEVGGTPTGTKVMPGPGEWHATGSTGSKSIMMVKGDMLVIPRGTLHKRSTEDSVTFMLISNPCAKA